jgi:hypothetical protein
LAESDGQLAQGLIQVYRALGGGWQIRCEPADSAETTPTVAPEKTPPTLESLPKPRPAVEAPKNLPKAEATMPESLPALQTKTEVPTPVSGPKTDTSASQADLGWQRIDGPR